MQEGSALEKVLACLLALAFLDVGGGKLLAERPYIYEFALIGAGQWFRVLVGILEVGGAIGMLIPRIRFWAALEIAAVMVGATFVNLTILRATPLVRLTGLSVPLFVLAAALAWLARPRGGAAV